MDFVNSLFGAPSCRYCGSTRCAGECAYPPGPPRTPIAQYNPHEYPPAPSAAYRGGGAPVGGAPVGVGGAPVGVGGAPVGGAPVGSSRSQRQHQQQQHYDPYDPYDQYDPYGRQYTSSGVSQQRTSRSGGRPKKVIPITAAQQDTLAAFLAPPGSSGPPAVAAANAPGGATRIPVHHGHGHGHGHHHTATTAAASVTVVHDTVSSSAAAAAMSTSAMGVCTKCTGCGELVLFDPPSYSTGAGAASMYPSVPGASPYLPSAPPPSSMSNTSMVGSSAPTQHYASPLASSGANIPTTNLSASTSSKRQVDPNAAKPLPSSAAPMAPGATVPTTTFGSASAPSTPAVPEYPAPAPPAVAAPPAQSQVQSSSQPQFSPDRPLNVHLLGDPGLIGELVARIRCAYRTDASTPDGSSSASNKQFTLTRGGRTFIVTGADGANEQADARFLAKNSSPFQAIVVVHDGRQGVLYNPLLRVATSWALEGSNRFVLLFPTDRTQPSTAMTVGSNDHSVLCLNSVDPRRGLQSLITFQEQFDVLLHGVVESGTPGKPQLVRQWTTECQREALPPSPLLDRQLAAIQGRRVVLILGQPGSGKSTLVNYLASAMWNAPSVEHPYVVVPNAAFPEMRLSKEVALAGGDVYDSSERNIFEASTNKTSMCGVYPIGDFVFIDTPPLSDSTRGAGDNMAHGNLQHIVDTLARIDKVHAVLMVVNPSTRRETVNVREALAGLNQFLPVSFWSSTVMVFSFSTPDEPIDEDGIRNSLPAFMVSATPRIVASAVRVQNSAFVPAREETINRPESDPVRRRFFDAWSASMQQLRELLERLRGPQFATGMSLAGTIQRKAQYNQRLSASVQQAIELLQTVERLSAEEQKAAALQQSHQNTVQEAQVLLDQLIQQAAAEPPTSRTLLRKPSPGQPNTVCTSCGEVTHANCPCPQDPSTARPVCALRSRCGHPVSQLVRGEFFMVPISGSDGMIARAQHAADRIQTVYQAYLDACQTIQASRSAIETANRDIEAGFEMLVQDISRIRGQLPEYNAIDVINQHWCYSDLSVKIQSPAGRDCLEVMNAQFNSLSMS